jgi:hypothetical protein
MVALRFPIRAIPPHDPNPATLRLFPGITAATIQAFLAPPIQGVVLETFGAGNAPQRKDLMSALREACKRGVVIVAITQCAKGSVSNAYETGRTLLEAGVVPGGDMTPEVRQSSFTSTPVHRKAVVHWGVCLFVYGSARWRNLATSSPNPNFPWIRCEAS